MKNGLTSLVRYAVGGVLFLALTSLILPLESEARMIESPTITIIHTQ